jgi:hypothetical protein
MATSQVHQCRNFNQCVADMTKQQQAASDHVITLCLTSSGTHATGKQATSSQLTTSGPPELQATGNVVQQASYVSDYF